MLMPRIARTVVPGLPLHVVQRGINRQDCFFAQSDYSTYLRYVSAFSARFGCSIHAYCLMTNHVHLLLTPGSAHACALFMKRLGQCYVQTVNKRLRRTGTLWEGRFHSSLIDSDNYVIACYRYIELNPVRAGLSSTPEDYPWSSYGVNSKGGVRSFLRRHPAYENLASNNEARAMRYRELCEMQFDDCTLQEIRAATRAGTPVGMPRPPRGRPAQAKDPSVELSETGSVPISC